MIIPDGNLPASLLMERIIRDNTDWLPERAAAFARQAHEGQTRKFTGAPYYTHVERVAAPEALSRSPQGRAPSCLQGIVSKTDFNVLQFYKSKNRKRPFSSTCGCFEMVEARGIEPLS